MVILHYIAVKMMDVEVPPRLLLTEEAIIEYYNREVTIVSGLNGGKKVKEILQLFCTTTPGTELWYSFFDHLTHHNRFLCKDHTRVLMMDEIPLEDIDQVYYLSPKDEKLFFEHRHFPYPEDQDEDEKRIVYETQRNRDEAKNKLKKEATISKWETCIAPPFTVGLIPSAYDKTGCHH